MNGVMARAAVAALAVGVAFPASAQLVGERPVIESHVDQAQIESGALSLGDLFLAGQKLFNAKFNFLDGQGRPAATGGGAPRTPDEPLFIRTSGPDANACFGCHNEPRSGGGGDFVANVFVLAQTLDPVTFSIDPQFSNERNSLGMNGSGAIEMLAREMTADLHAIREQARLAAVASGAPATRPLLTKGVSFGSVTVLPDGRVDPTGIVGCDWDLIIKPFHQKGAVVSLREFTNNAMNHHHGMQSVERFGLGVDHDQDGVVNELTVGDITATTIYQAALNVPTRVPSKVPARRAAAEQGEVIFAQIGCTQCHMAELILNNPVFSEPNPYNPPGNLRPGMVSHPFTWDLTMQGEAPRIERRPDGSAVVRAFTDLKRHDLNDDDYNHFANEQVPQGALNGFSPASVFTIPPPPRPTRQFLTRKLWDAGSSAPYGHRGDLTTLTEAIYYHGGEARAVRDAYFALPATDQAAVIEFLMSLQVVQPQLSPAPASPPVPLPPPRGPVAKPNAPGADQHPNSGGRDAIGL